jgi:hypothetical protein
MSRAVQDELPLPRVLIHLHVPKCAGSSINFAMARARRGRVLSGEPRRVTERLSARVPEENDALFDAVGGHFQWGMHRHFTKPHVYFSAVREPVDRICSFFNYIHTTPSHPLHTCFRETLPDLNALTADFIRQTHGLLGSWSDYFCLAYTGRNLARKGRLDLVKQHVQREIEAGRMLVGELEAIKMLLHANGLLPPNGELPTLNAGDEMPEGFVPAKPATLSPRVRDLLRRFNRHDLQLMEFLEDTGLLARAENFDRLPAAAPCAGAGNPPTPQ